MATTVIDAAGSDPILQLLSNGAGTDKLKITAAGQHQGSDGSASSPALSFLSDTDTGIYRSASNEIDFAVGGATVGNLTSSVIGFSPSTLFDVRKDQASATTALRLLNNDNTSGTSNARLSVGTGGSSSGDPFLYFSTQDATGWGIGIDNSDSDKLKIYTGDPLNPDTPSGGAPKLTIGSDGKVGIGTSTPGALLDLKANSSSVQLLRLDDTPRTSGKEWAVSPGIEAAGKLSIRSITDSLTFCTLGYDSGLLNQQFQVGPTTKQTSGAITLGVGQHTALGTSDDANSVGIAIVSDNSYGQPFGDLFWTFRNNADTGFFYAGQIGCGKIGAVDKSYIKFMVNDGTATTVKEVMRIDQNLRVGIGTTSPAYALDVVGDINTNSAVRKNGTAYNNPDYVFEPDYKLLSLDELRAYIKTNKHLPKMPTTEEIRKDGVEIFEQGRLILEKMEEAYLYILQLEDRVKAAETSRSAR